MLADSTATSKDDFSSNGYRPLREQLIHENALHFVAGDGMFVFRKDVTFASPSAAAFVITNHNTNGRTAWRLIDASQTLKEWQDAQIFNP